MKWIMSLIIQVNKYSVYNLDNQEADLKLTSIEKSRESYQEIIGSFKNIHKKLEQWHKNKDEPDKGYGALVEQQTANFENLGPENLEENAQEEEEKFLYEFEKHNSHTIDSSYHQEKQQNNI